MPRIPYIPDSAAQQEGDEIVARIRDRRIAGGHEGLVELDRMLLHAPPVAEGWNSFLGAIRTRTMLDDVTREIIICRVAVLNGAEYEWGHHAPLLIKALVQDNKISELDANRSVEALSKKGDEPMGMELAQAHWLDHHRPLLAYVDAMTKDVHVEDKVFEALRSTLPEGPEGDRHMVEITATCASYNCVSRFLVALNVGDKNPAS